jgi:hypothetical protein
MQPLQFIVPVGALESVAGLLPYAVLVLLLANMVTRVVAHRRHEAAVEDGAESLSRVLPHELTNVALILASFAYLVVAPHSGMVTTVLVAGVVVSDFFEFEARNVEARNGLEFERPKASIVTSVLALLYAAYVSLFFLIEPVWSQIV